MHFEAACVTRLKPTVQKAVPINDRSLLIVSGMGIDAAAQGARKLVAAGADCLLSFGCSGALTEELRAGELVQPDKVYATDREYTPRASLPEAARQRLSRAGVVIRTGALVCHDRMIASAAAKRQAHSTTGAVTVDMESAGVLETAEDSGLPAYVLRVIVDGATETIPAAVSRNIDRFGRVRKLRLAIALVKAPAQIPALARLGKASVRATQTMRVVSRALFGRAVAQ